MSARSILARTFFVLSAVVAAYATTIATAKPARAGEELACPNSSCRDGSQLCCTHSEGGDTFYYYKN
jgi:hypothetical protein